MHKEALLCLFLEPITSILSREKKVVKCHAYKRAFKNAQYEEQYLVRSNPTYPN